jgi:hypothetical protein
MPDRDSGFRFWASARITNVRSDMVESGLEFNDE